MIEFQIAGPYIIPHYRSNGVKHFDKEGEDQFWDDCEADLDVDLSERKGCYAFGMRTKRIRPWYVGKTWNGFGYETFGVYQQTKISQFINEFGAPVVFFVYKPFKNKEGNKTKETILGLERFLTQAAVWVNPELLNVRGAQAQWKIRGVIRSEPSVGQPAKALTRFTKMLNLK
jgi:hypothetical protein